LNARPELISNKQSMEPSVSTATALVKHVQDPMKTNAQAV